MSEVATKLQDTIQENSSQSFELKGSSFREQFLSSKKVENSKTPKEIFDQLIKDLNALGADQRYEQLISKFIEDWSTALKASPTMNKEELLNLIIEGIRDLKKIDSPKLRINTLTLLGFFFLDLVLNKEEAKLLSSKNLEFCKKIEASVFTIFIEAVEDEVNKLNNAVNSIDTLYTAVNLLVVSLELNDTQKQQIQELSKKVWQSLTSKEEKELFLNNLTETNQYIIIRPMELTGELLIFPGLAKEVFSLAKQIYSKDPAFAERLIRGSGNLLGNEISIEILDFLKTEDLRKNDEEFYKILISQLSGRSFVNKFNSTPEKILRTDYIEEAYKLLAEKLAPFRAQHDERKSVGEHDLVNKEALLTRLERFALRAAASNGDSQAVSLLLGYMVGVRGYDDKMVSQTTEDILKDYEVIYKYINSNPEKPETISLIRELSDSIGIMLERVNHKETSLWNKEIIQKVLPRVLELSDGLIASTNQKVSSDVETGESVASATTEMHAVLLTAIRDSINYRSLLRSTAITEFDKIIRDQSTEIAKIILGKDSNAGELRYALINLLFSDSGFQDVFINALNENKSEHIVAIQKLLSSLKSKS